MPPDNLDVHALADAIAERLAGLIGQASQRYLSVADAALYTGLSQDSARALISSGKLTGLRPVSGRVLIDRHEFDAMLHASTRARRQGRGIRPQPDRRKDTTDADRADAHAG